jgi:hypothetical protein
MKKVILTAIVFTFAVFTTVDAKVINEPVIVNVVNEDEEGTEVKAEELPEAVKTTLGSEEYASWNIAKCSLVKAGHYKIDLINGEEKQTVELCKEGKEVAIANTEME